MDKKEILEKVDFDLERAKSIYNWLNEDRDIDHIPSENCTCVHDEITAYEDKTGGKWVRVKIFDEDFLIAPTDYSESRTLKNRFALEEAKKEMAYIGLSMWTKKQVLLAIAYSNKINQKLNEIGGSVLESEYWTDTESDEFYAWCVSFKANGMACLSMATDMAVRPIFNLSKRKE